MRPWPRIAIALLLSASAPLSAAAQGDLIGLEKARELFTSNQSRQAARELSLVSVEFRNEIGRCRDESIGAKLMELEPRFDALASRLAAGTVTNVAELDKEFVVIDHLLAENHLQLAATGWGLRRFGHLEVVGKDLGVAARYLVRSSRWSRRPLATDVQKAVDDALATSAKLVADPANPPAESGAVIEALAKVMKAPELP